MRHIYLIRHGRPEFPGGQDRCIGRTDCPLSKEGLYQAKKLGGYFSGRSISAVYSSELTRSVQTGGEIADGAPHYRKETLREIDCGVWEGLTFAEIRDKYPELYEKRGTDPVHFFPKGGESLTEGLERFGRAVEDILSQSEGDVVIVAHASVNRAFLCELTHTKLRNIYSLPQPYGCITEITEERGALRVGRLAYMPQEIPDEETVRFLWRRYGTPENVAAHCRAVAGKASEITEKLAEKGYVLDNKLVHSAALLHDMARAGPDHAAVGARLLTKEGYANVADIIACHHGLDEGETAPVTAKTVVFLADKLVSGEREVSLEERFEKSRSKCLTAEAIKAHDIRYGRALSAQKRVRRLINGED